MKQFTDQLSVKVLIFLIGLLVGIIVGSIVSYLNFNTLKQIDQSPKSILAIPA